MRFFNYFKFLLMPNTRNALLLIILMFPISTIGQSEFKQPWLDKTRPLIIDAYQGNHINWNKMAKDKRVRAVIHRASIGMRADTKFKERKREAKKRGYHWGSYHLGRPGEPIKQADFYLKNAEPDKSDLLVIDIEAIGGNNMRLADAIVFANRVKEKTGRLPLIYSNHTVTKHISDNFGLKDIFKDMPLWYARFRNDIPNFPSGTWKSYTLWQFACEINCARYSKHPGGKRRYDCNEAQPGCPYQVPGTDRCMDINVYFGTGDELKKRWPFTK